TRLLGVELSCRERAVFDRGDEAAAVSRPGDGGLAEGLVDLQSPVLRGEGMHEVEALLLEAREQARTLADLDRAPAHVGYDGRLEFANGAAPLSESLDIVTPLDTALEHDLHAHADAEHRASAR